MITILFWPFMIASIISSFAGLLFMNFRFLYISAVLIIPMSLYFAFTPRFIFWSLVFPLFYIGSAIYIKKKRRIIALIMNLPNYLIIGWIGYVVLNQ